MIEVSLKDGLFGVAVKVSLTPDYKLGSCVTRLMLGTDEECRFMGAPSESSLDKAKAECERVLNSLSGEDGPFVAKQYKTYLRLLNKAQRRAEDVLQRNL